jgi:hypothetical protein
LNSFRIIRCHTIQLKLSKSSVHNRLYSVLIILSYKILYLWHETVHRIS